MNCTTQEDFNSAIEFGRIINETHRDQTADVTVSFLDNTTGNVEKIDGSYKAKGGKASIKESVTEKVSKKKPYRGKPNPLLEQQGLIGNQVHELTEFVAQSILNHTNNVSNDSAIKYIQTLVFTGQEGLKKINEGYGKELDDQSIQNLIEGVKDVLLTVYRTQRTKNTLTGKQGKATIRLEQVVIDPKRGIGGTIDLLAIYSDNTASVIDFKTKILKADNKDSEGNIIDGGKIITNYDLEKYKLQTGEYGRILRESYGVKEIHSVFIFPIKLNIGLNVKAAKYANTIRGLKFPGQDPLLAKVLPFSNKTGFKELDLFIRDVDDKIKRLEQRIKADPKSRDSLQERTDRLELVKKEIFINHNLDSVIAYGRFLSDKVDKAELNQLNIPELQDLLGELVLIENITNSTRGYRTFLKKTSKAEEIDEVEKKIGLMETEIKDKIGLVKDVYFKDKVAKLIEAASGFKVLDDYGNYIPFAQEGYFGKIFYQLSQYDTPAFKTLKKILNSINYKVRQNVDEVTDEIVRVEGNVEKWRTQTGRSFEDLIKIMINPATDNFWGRYDGEYIEEMKLANGSTLYKYFEPTDKYNERYQDRLDKEIKRLEEAGYKDKFLEDATQKWVSKNSLELENGRPKYPDAWERGKRFNWLHMKDSPENYNQNYKFILSIPELKAYYEMFEKYNKKFRDMLGVDYTKLPNNFLPNIRKTISERVTEQGTNGLIAGTQDFFKDFSIREEDRSEDTSYNSNEQIPIFFLNRFRSKDGGLQVGEKSYQFGRSLAIFAKMAFDYEATTEREAEIIALQQFLETEAEQITQSRGKNLIDQMGNQLTEKLQANDLPEIFRSFVDMYVYKIGIKSVIGDKSGTSERMLMKAKEYFTLKVLGFNVIAGLGSFATAKINTIVESNKGIIFNSTNYKESMQASWDEREKFLALSAYFDPMSHRLNNPRIAGEQQYGERFYSDPTMRGWINKYINSRMLMNVFSVGDQYIEEVVTAAMAKNYYVDDLGNLRRITNATPESSWENRTVWDLFSYSKEDGVKLNLKPEQIENVFTSFRDAVQAGQSRIKGTIPEDDKAAWQHNIFGQLMMHFKSWMPGIIFERFGKVKYDSRIDSLYMGKYIALSKEFQNPDKLVFTTFFKQILLPRFGKLLADITTFGLLSKNRLNDKLNKELYFEKWLDENPHYRGKVTFEDFNEIQQKQLKSIIQELRVLLVIAGLILLVGFDYDDDGEKDYKKYLLTRKLASLLFKVEQELSFVYSPVAFSTLIKNPVPTIGLVNDGYKLLKNTIDEGLDPFFGEERLIGGETKDKKPILSESIKLVPGSAGIIRFFDFLSNDVQYSKTQQ